MLGRIKDLLQDSTEISGETLTKAMRCAGHFTVVLPALTKPQRQKWMSLLVGALPKRKPFRKRVISNLEILWRADDDPRRSCATEAPQRAHQRRFAEGDPPVPLLLKSHAVKRAAKALRKTTLPVFLLSVSPSPCLST